MCRLSLRLLTSASLFMGALSWGNVNLVFSPASQTAIAGQTVNIDVYAVSDSSSNQGFSALDILATWSPTYLNPITYTNSGAGYAWGNSGFLFPTLNGSLSDGDAEWTGERQLGGPVPLATPAGLKLTTLRFTAIAPTTGTAVSMPATLSGRTTRVFHPTIPNTPILGLRSPDAMVTIIMPATQILGSLVLQDTVFTGPFTRTIQAVVKQGGVPIATVPISGIHTQSVAFSVSVPGAYSGLATIEFDGSSFLRRKYDVVLNNGTMNLGAANLINGDVDYDGEVGPTDVDRVISEFGSQSDTDADADISGEVDPIDIDIVIANFGTQDDI